MKDNLVTPDNLDSMESNTDNIPNTNTQGNFNIPVEDCWNSDVFIKLVLTICFIIIIILIINVSDISLIK